MKRRDFITLLGGAAATWPIAARAEQSAMPVVGYLDQYTAEPRGPFVAAFRQGLAETGYIEGRNVAVEFRSANNDVERLPELVGDLLRHRTAVIVTPFGSAAARAAKSATTTIPIVFITSSDPVQEFLVASFNRPGGNATGLSTMSVEQGAKRLGILHEIVPAAARIAAVINPKSTIAESLIDEVQKSASVIGWRIEVEHASSVGEIDDAFEGFEKKRIEAAYVSPDVFFNSRRVQFATLSAYHRIPVIYAYRGFAEVGGLLSYGPGLSEQYRQMGVYAGRILKGESAANLPVLQPSRFELVINLGTARTLKFAVPPTLLAIADEVIE